MSDSSKNNPVPNKVVEVLVDSIFRKNGIKPDELKTNVSDEQKQLIKEMVEDLKSQVEQFGKNNKKGNNE